MNQWSAAAAAAADVFYLCVQVPGQPTGPSEAAPPVSQLQPERRPHGSRPL